METSNSKNINKNSIYYLLYTIANILFPFISGIYVARILLPSNIGDVTAAQNFAQYFIILAFLGIPTYGLREISKVKSDLKKLNKVYSELMVINFISTFIFLFIYIILIFIIPAYRCRLTLFLITGLSIAANFLNNQFLFEGIEDFKNISIRNIIFRILTFILLVFLVRSTDDYIIYSLLTVFSIVGNYLISIIYAKKYVKFSIKNLNLKRHMKSILYISVVNLAIELYTLTDITMLDLFSTPENVTFYSYGNKISKSLLQVMNCFTIVIVPKLSESFESKNNAVFNSLLRKAFLILFVLGLPMIIGILFTSDSLIISIYGSNYIKSSFVLKILSLNLVISPIGYLLGSRVMLCANQENKMIFPVIVGAIINIILNMILIPNLFEVGAAIASVISEFCVMLTYLVLSYKYYSISKVIPDICKIIFSVLVMSLLLVALTWLNITYLGICILQIIFGAVSYFCFLLILKEEIVFSYINNIIKLFK